MKILFAFILAMLFLISFSFIIFTENPNAGIITFTPVSFLVFVVYFGHVFLNLEISSKTISIKKRVQGLETSHKELMHIATSLYKLLMILFASKQTKFASKKFLNEYMKISLDIDKYLDEDEINSFSDLMVKLQSEDV